MSEILQGFFGYLILLVVGKYQILYTAPYAGVAQW